MYYFPGRVLLSIEAQPPLLYVGCCLSAAANIPLSTQHCLLPNSLHPWDKKSTRAASHLGLASERVLEGTRL